MKQNEREDCGYLTDEELEKLITDVEQNHMMQAPEYMTDIILNRAERQAVKDSVEIIPIRHTIVQSIREKQTPVIVPKSKKVQLLSYSAKIIAAAAAAIALIIMIPAMQGEQTQQSVSESADYQQDWGGKRQDLKDNKSFAQSLNDGSSSLCNQLFEGTSKLIRREER